jgi:hypothetical protein
MLSRNDVNRERFSQNKKRPLKDTKITRHNSKQTMKKAISEIGNNTKWFNPTLIEYID